MAKQFYKKKAGGTELHATDDDQKLIISDLAARDVALDEILSLGDSLRGFLAQGGIPALGIPGGSPTAFDDFVESESWRIKDLLSYQTYSNKVIEVTVCDGEWITPEALESVSDEIVGNEGSLSIDGDNGTYWQSEINGLRTIFYRLLGFPKKVEQLRFRTNTGEGRTELQGMTVKMSRGLNGIDDAGNVVATGVDILRGADSSTEWVLPVPKSNVRYIKLEVATSTHTSPDHVRIRELAVRVITANHEV